MIVFRGGFLLKDQQSTKGCMVMIDEPEISLHPNWQKKILGFYKQLFTDEEHNQTSQIFFSTHSPFVIHNDTRYNDMVIILKKDENGKIFISDNPMFDKVAGIDIVKDAFNINDFRISPAIDVDKNIIITEGKTDWKHLKNAYEYYKLQAEYKELNIAFLEYEDNMGDTQLEIYLKKLVNDIQGRRMIGVYDNRQKIIGIFDNDEKTGKQYDKPEPVHFGNNVYGCCIPNPRKLPYGISIEFLYEENDIKKEDSDGRRLFQSDEFKEKNLRLKTNNDISCTNNKIKECYKNKVVKIIDSNVFDGDENSLALSKEDFAQNIITKTPPFGKVKIHNFKEVFDMLKKIVSK